MDKEYYSKTKEHVFKELNTSKDGLNTIQALELLARNGRNELPVGRKDSLLKLFLSQFINPMEIILIITVILSFIIGETIDAITLSIIILVDVIIGTIEEYRARKDAESLLNMIKPTSIVVRDGKEIEIDSGEIVVGDILSLESGDKVSADARIIECHNFQVNESALTGESAEVLKNPEKIELGASLGDRKNMVYAGTSATTGRAKAVVVATATDTEIGKIAEKVTNTEEEKSPLTIRTEKFTKQISIIIIISAIIIAFVLYKNNYSMSDIFLSVIALSVSAMPEGLPLALTMALTIASKRMAKKNVIVKKLNSVESLGSCTVIASDKTGTLTVNEQTAKEIVLSDGSRFKITGTGYNGDGEVIPENGEDINLAKEIAFLGKINNEAFLEKEDGKWNSFGDSIDIAFLSLAKKLGLSGKPEIVETIPYESENQFSAVYYKKNDKIYCTVKGSLEKVMGYSEEKDLYKEQNTELTSKGYRVIALADGPVDGTNVNDIKNLKFIGMVAFIDPIRQEAKNSIKECMTAGIKVIMITGDHPLTAYAIAKDLGLCEKQSEVATGKDIEKYKARGEKEFDRFVSCIKVFSRVTPLDKLDIVNSLKRQGEFVAVTGDGVNDAPAIKTANIGIAMGSGTDVAKETASMIIADDNFTSIVEGVKEGRTAYSNIRKITLFLLGCGFAEVAFFVLSIACGFSIPLVAIQLLWLNIITDGLQDIALSFEKGEENIMKEKPRDTKESLFSRDLKIEVGILGITITAIVFGVWKYLMDKGTDLTYARSIIMMLMVFIQNINVLNCRSEKRTVFKESFKDNPLVIFVIIGSFLLQLILAEIPITAKFLNVTPISYGLVAQIFLLSLTIIVVFEIYKIFYRFFKLRKDLTKHENEEINQ